MDVNGTSSNSATQSEEDMYLRRGPWTVEEDLLLMNYITTHGEGRWNSLARCAGLKRTGKSCRLRWLNYLRPDVRRGNITPEEQLTILELHSRWGNRWSKIAQYLPGRTDNEIKNYWRTRVQKHAKQLKCDVNSKQFKDTMRYLWMPRLVERIRAASGASSGGGAVGTATNQRTFSPPEISAGQVLHIGSSHDVEVAQVSPNLTTPAASSEPLGAQLSGRASDPTHRYSFQGTDLAQAGPVTNLEYIASPYGYNNHEVDLESMGPNSTWLSDVELSENLWNVDDVWFLQQQFCNSV